MTAAAPTEITVSLPQLHRGQLRRRERIAAHRSRFVVTMCGRRWGKTIDGEEWMEEGALASQRCGWFAPNYKYLTEVWDSFVHRLGPAIKHKDATEKRIEVMGGGLIECWTMDDPEAGRSRKYHRVVIDEAGIVRNLRAIWTNAIRPTLVDYRGDAWFYGTPKGRTHDFSQLFAKGESEDEHWLSFRAPTRENPYIPADEIEAARRDMPEAAFLQEFEGIPADDQANPFGTDAIRKCVDLLSDEEPIAWGWDFARAQDWTVGIGLDKNGRVCRFHRWQRVPWAESRRDVKRFSGTTFAQGDSTGIGDVIVEDLQRDGMQIVGFQFTQKSKQVLMERLAAAIQQQQVRFPDGVIRSELETFEYTYSAGGVKYTAPDGLHDDCVMALALAVYCYDRVAPFLPKPQPPVWRPDDNQDPEPWERASVPQLSTMSGSMGQLPGENW